MRQNEEILFKNWQWGECLDYLNNIVQHSDNIVLLSGCHDSGKTTLKQELISLLPDHFKTFSMYGEPRLGVASFMRQITIGFGLSWDSNGPPDWEELRRAIFSQPDCSWILLIDDAEKLSWDTLNALINLYTTVSAEGSQFSLILFADVSLSDSIKNSVLKDFFETKFQIVDLQSLELEEMTIFLRDHMKLIFDRKTLKKIYNASNGVIGKVKQLAVSELNIRNTGETMVFKNLLENIISPPVVRVVVCGGLLFVAYILFGITQTKDAGSVDIVMEQEAQTSVQNVQVAQNERIVNSKIQTQRVIDNIAVPAVALQTVASTSHENIQQYDQLYQKLHTDLKNSLQEQLSQLQIEVNRLQEKITKLPATIATTATTQKILIEKTPSTIKPNLTTKPTNIVKTNTLQINNAEKQLLKVAKNRYVLQLMASKNEQSAKRLISNHPALSNKVKYFCGKFRPQEDAWFVVVHGSYVNKESAISDIKNLPTELQKLKPIVRDYASVHQLINNKH